MMKSVKKKLMEQRNQTRKTSVTDEVHRSMREEEEEIEEGGEKRRIRRLVSESTGSARRGIDAELSELDPERRTPDEPENN